MAKYGSYRGYILDNFGRPIDAVTVTVYLKGTVNLATLYSNRTGSQSLSNPFTSESDGSYIFYADSINQYDIVYSKSGVTFDSTDSQDVVVQIDSSNVPLLDANNTFTGTNAFSTPLGKSSLPASVAYEDEANTLTQPLADTAASDITSIGADGVKLSARTVLFQHSGSLAHISYDGAADEIGLVDTGVANNIKFNVGTGKMTAGIVPLARLSAADGGGYPQGGTGGETLRFLRGRVNADGTIASGTGFTISKFGTGQYGVNFSTAFSSAPIIVVTLHNYGFFHAETPLTTGVNVNTRDSAGTLADRPFSFLVAGPA